MYGSDHNIPSHDSSDLSHFSSPVGLRYFKDVAAVAGNRRIKRGNYLMHVYGHTQRGAFFKHPDILKNILPVSTLSTCTVQCQEGAF